MLLHSGSKTTNDLVKMFNFIEYPTIAFRGEKYISKNDKSRKSFDVIMVSGDAYVDHPSFPSAVVCRLLQHLGLSVAIIAQPDWNSDEDFKVWGEPNMFFAIAPGAMDSMVANYTSASMPRSKDRLSPDGQPGLRPKRALQVYVQKIHQLFKNSMIIAGGVEGSMRRFSHYDYWENKVKDPVLMDAPANLLIYGMAEAVYPKVIDWLKNGKKDVFPQIPQTVIKVKHDSWRDTLKDNFKLLPDIETCRKDKAVFMELSKVLDTCLKPNAEILIQQHVKGDILCFPPTAEMFDEEIDMMDRLKFNRRSHPIYKKPIPGLEPVQFSVQSHRGCLSACSFCALSLHQGRIIRSRSKESILAEIASFVEHPDFKGIVPDVGGPAVNMYGWECAAGGCNRRMCVHPAICKNLRHSLKPLAEVLKAAVKIKGVRKVFLGSGLRYDLIRDDEWDVFEYIIFNHISGQLKVAPEHFDKRVLTLMRKGANADFAAFAKKFYDSCDRHHKKLFLVPYLMTAFPGSQEGDKKLIKTVKELHLVHEQIQEFTPTPGSMGSAMFYTETDLDGKPVWVPKTRTARMSTRNKLQKK